MVADLGRLTLERRWWLILVHWSVSAPWWVIWEDWPWSALLAADLIRLPSSPSGGQFGQVGPALMTPCYDENSLLWYSIYVNK